jgi:type VII secretion-associated serine protease mycosin
VGAVAVACLAALVVPGQALGVPAPRAPFTCDNPADPGGTVTAVPWAQQTLALQQVQQLSTGTGVTVAVIDSGVDDSHPQLAGQVLAGFDFLRNTAGGNVDCASHGTAVASLIAAKHVAGIGFAGLAPGVRILPVRVSEHEEDAQGNAQGDSVSPDVFAQAIRWAADNGARILNISLTLDHDYQPVADAVTYAQDKGCLIVAAVGNHHSAAVTATPGLGDVVPATVDPPSYPAAYQGVLGVGAVNQDGTRLDQSQVGPYVDLVAPGGGVLAATRVGGYSTWSGTSFAAPLVSAAAALVWAVSPQLKNTDVAHRLEVTADPLPDSGRTNEFGHGLVDPYRAVTELLPNGSTAPAAALPARTVDAAAADRTAHWQSAGHLALGAGLLVLALVVLAWLVALALRRGRARHWRPGVPVAPQQRASVEEPEELFFALPGRQPRE